MNPLKVQKVSDKTHVHSETSENQLTLPPTENEERVSGNLKIMKLNRDCLAQVLMHLSVLDRLEMEKVCKKWEEATQMSFYNIKKLNFNDLKITLDKKEETWRMILEKYGRYLKDLTITYEYPWICNIIQEECPNITRLDIDMSVLNEYDEYPFLVFRQTISRIPKLKYFKITIDSDKSPDFFTRLLELIPADMEEIHLVSPEPDELNPTDWKPSVSVVPDKFKSLRCLTLKGFDLGQSIMELISLNNETLVHLDLARCNSTPNVSVFSKLNNLEYLNLNLITNLKADIVTAIAINCPKLKHFEYANENHDDPDFEELDIVTQDVFSNLKYLKNLEYLYFQGLDTDNYADNFLSPITNNCVNLKHFNVEYGVYFSVSNIKEITKLNNLESLNLNGADMKSKSLIDIANNCLELKDLTTTFEGINKAALSKLKNLKKLEILRFHQCGNLSGNLLIDIVNNCKNLIDLDLSKCYNITEASLLQVGKLQHLKILNIDSVENVPNAMFYNFCKLEYLSCRYCRSVTDEGIMKVLDNCKNLNHLNVCYSGITVESLIHAAKREFIFTMLDIFVEESFREKYSPRHVLKSPYIHVRYWD